MSENNQTHEYSCVSLPKDLIFLVDQTIAGKGYSSRAEYVKHLIRNDIKEAQTR